MRWDYKYDKLKRLTSATQITNGAESAAYAYKYDRNGNRKEKSVRLGGPGAAASTYTYTHNALDQIREERLNGSLQKTLHWDYAGRLTEERSAAGAVDRAFAWSVDDRLLAARVGNTELNYAYDYAGSRVGRVEKSATTGAKLSERRYLADYQNLTGYSQILAETDAPGTAFHRNYVYSQGHEPLAQTGLEAPGTSFFHPDHLGTTRGLTSPTGSAIPASNFTYTPFGDPTSGDRSLTNHHFTGQFREEGTGLQWHRARWLDVTTNSWHSTDPAVDFPIGFYNPLMALGGNPITHFQWYFKLC